MRGLELHPKFQDLKEDCSKFPEHSEQLFQVYLDLTEAKDFEDVAVIQSPLLGRCLIEGTHPDNAQRFLILPSFITESWTVAKLESVFSALSKEHDARLSAAALSRITLGVVSADSTITYMNLYRGVPPENAQVGYS
ncbi:hypothetical protein BGZ72_006662 [Mortierella alpina]|nr:hypothetical protein BGZ72_006662 [Mortierella alpina]